MSKNNDAFEMVKTFLNHFKIVDENHELPVPSVTIQFSPPKSLPVNPEAPELLQVIMARKGDTWIIDDWSLEPSL